MALRSICFPRRRKFVVYFVMFGESPLSGERARGCVVTGFTLGYCYTEQRLVSIMPFFSLLREHRLFSIFFSFPSA